MKLRGAKIRLYDKLKSVFNIFITPLDQLVHWNEIMYILLCCVCNKQKFSDSLSYIQTNS